MQVLVSLLLVLCLCNCADLYAQSIRLERSFPPVRVDGDPLNLAFAGGLNSPQFSAADLNNDGRTDLLAFDRVGHVPLAFVREVDGTFSFRPELLEHFPQVVGWMLLRDYDGDEVPDIFAYQGLPVSSVQVYRGRYNAAGKLEFTPYPFGRNPNVIHVPVPGSTNDTQLYVSEIDVPDINDIDYDGDLDILTFNFAGGYLEYYQNQSVEQGYGADSLIFELVETCWGGIYESGLSTALDLSSEAGECASNFGPGVGGRHSGSTVLTLDEDGDGDKDLLLGDISFPYLTFGRNGGDRNLAWINEQDETFPADDVPANLPLFPAPFYVDVDGDQVRDLVVTTNQERNGIDHENVWYYQNTNTDSDPRFRLFQQDLLVGEMLDLGTGCRPAILDYNADGLMDLVVGNYSYFELFGARNPRLHLYENVGTANSPAFALVDDDFLNMSQFSSSSFHYAPAFGDLDGDGDWDALVGEQNGYLFFAENLAGPDNPVSFSEPVYAYMNIRIGLASVPQIVDLNRDGLADLLIGERTGNINYFENIGEAGAPRFQADEEMLPNRKRLGGIDMRIPGFSTAYSSPWLVDFGEHFELFVGSQWGVIAAYDSIGPDLSADFREVYPNLPGIREGEQLHPLLYDFDQDGFLELIVGNYRGGLSWFTTNIQLDGTVDSQDLTVSADFRLYPNPARHTVRIDGPGSGTWDLTIFDASGRVVKRLTTLRQPQLELAVEHLAAGVYVVRIQQGAWQSQQKLVVFH